MESSSHEGIVGGLAWPGEVERDVALVGPQIRSDRKHRADLKPRKFHPGCHCSQSAKYKIPAMKPGRAMANAISIVFSCPGYIADAQRDRIPSLGTGGRRSKATLQC